MKKLFLIAITSIVLLIGCKQPTQIEYVPEPVKPGTVKVIFKDAVFLQGNGIKLGNEESLKDQIYFKEKLVEGNRFSTITGGIEINERGDVLFVDLDQVYTAKKYNSVKSLVINPEGIVEKVENAEDNSKWVCFHPTYESKPVCIDRTKITFTFDKTKGKSSNFLKQVTNENNEQAEGSKNMEQPWKFMEPDGENPVVYPAFIENSFNRPASAKTVSVGRDIKSIAAFLGIDISYIKDIVIE